MSNIAQAINMVKYGASLKEVSSTCKVPMTTLRNKLRAAGVQSPGQKIWHSNLEKKPEIRRLRKLGYSFSEISTQTGVNPQSISSWCLDIVLSEKQIKENLGVNFEKRDQAVELRKNGEYVTEIAAKLGVNKRSVCDWISQHEKKTGEDLQAKSNLRKKKESSAKCGSDKVNLKKVIGQRLKGWSINEIADNLSVSLYAVKIVLKQHTFSADELSKINKKVKQRIAARRKKGDLKPAGGAREGSGRAKSGYYKGFYCGSTYELCWVVYAIDHNIGFSRFPETLKHNGVTYVPDFLLDDGTTIIELKGYEREGAVAKKTAVAEYYGYTVKVLRKDDLQFAFEYIKKYNVTQENCYTLYDSHKPKYELKCCYCEKEFARERMYVKKSGGPVFCTLVCSGKYRSVQNKDYTRSNKKRKSKWSKEQIIAVFYAKDTHREIAKQFNMNLATISLIKNKKIYEEVTKDL